MDKDAEVDVVVVMVLEEVGEGEELSAPLSEPSESETQTRSVHPYGREDVEEEEVAVTVLDKADEVEELPPPLRALKESDT